MKLNIVQDPARYYSTGDYFKMIAPGMGIQLVTDEEMADVAIYFSKRDQRVKAKIHIGYERDPHRATLVDMSLDRKFYTQYCNCPEEDVILHAAHPEIHKRTLEPRHDIVFCGRLYEEERLPWLNALKDAGLDIVVYGDGYTPAQYIERLNDGRIILNFSEMGEINRRIFEAMAIGCCVTDRVDHIEEVGEEGKHFFVFDKEDAEVPVKAIELLYNLVEDTKLTEKVAKESRKHIIKNHTYEDRLLALLRKGNICSF